MGWYVDDTLNRLESKAFEASVLRARCDTGIRISLQPWQKMTIKGLPGGLPPHIALSQDALWASWDGKEFKEWPEGKEAGVHMFRMLDPRVYRPFIGAERLIRLSPGRTIGQYTYKVAPLLDSINLPKGVRDDLHSIMGEERDIAFDVQTEGGRLMSVTQRDLYPLEEEVSVVILQDC